MVTKVLTEPSSVPATAIRALQMASTVSPDHITAASETCPAEVIIGSELLTSREPPIARPHQPCGARSRERSCRWSIATERDGDPKARRSCRNQCTRS
jgi:hypothetical protein